MTMLQGLNRRFAFQCGLEYWVVVRRDIPQRGLHHVLARAEVTGFDHIADPAIEAPRHAVGLRRSGLAQAMLNAKVLAQHIKLMVTTDLALTASKQSLKELLAVVGQPLGDVQQVGALLRKCIHPTAGGLLA